MGAPGDVDPLAVFAEWMSALPGVCRAAQDEVPAVVAHWSALPGYGIFRLCTEPGGVYGFLVLGLADPQDVETHLELSRWSHGVARHLRGLIDALEAELARRGCVSVYTYSTRPGGGPRAFAKFLEHVGFGAPVQTWVSRLDLAAPTPAPDPTA